MPVIKKDKDGKPVLDDGKLVLVDKDKDGNEVESERVDPVAYAIRREAEHTRLMSENTERRLKLTDTEKKLGEALGALKVFEDAGITDPAKVKEDQDLLVQLKQQDEENKGKKVDVAAEIAKQTAKVREEMTEVHTKALGEKDEEIIRLQGIIRNKAITAAINGASFLEKLTIGPDMVAMWLSEKFDVDKDGNVFGKKEDGEMLFSQNAERGGQAATPSEVIQYYVDRYPDKDRILKAAPGADGKGGEKRDGVAPPDKASPLDFYPTMQE